MDRFIQTGVYQRLPSQETLAPSMDISVSSNLERYLYYLCHQDGNQLNSWMKTFETTGELSIGPEKLLQVQQDFMSYCSNRNSILETIKETWIHSSYLLCPHTATAVNAAYNLQLNSSLKTICLATAHPGKFYSTILLAMSYSNDNSNLTCDSTTSTRIIPQLPPIPKELDIISNDQTNKHIISGNIESIKSFIRQHIPIPSHLQNNNSKNNHKNKIENKERFYYSTIVIISIILITFLAINNHSK